MTIGWIGAGKVGFSLGKYLSGHGVKMSGYYSRDPESAREAAEFTGTGFYGSMEELVSDSDVIFITVPDDAIGQVWEQLKQMQMTDKIICHCSGVLSSEIFSDKHAHKVYGYSIHPLLAVYDKLHSYQEFSGALFTIEGDEKHRQELAQLIEGCGNPVIFIRPQDKVRYHAAAVLASNLVLGLAKTAMEELTACGFTEEAAKAALAPFMQANISHLKEQSLEQSLTGPVERGDVTTIRRHMEVLSGENREIYRLLSKKALAVAEKKNYGRDYTRIERQLDSGMTLVEKGAYDE